MDIQNDALEMQIAFEKNHAKSCGVSYEDLKAELDHRESIWGIRYLETSPRHEKWLVWSEAWQQAKKSAVPDGSVLVPKLSANYLFNIVPELGFKHQDQKDTVLYHLNYMASEFKDSAKKFIEADHAKQKEMIKAQEQSE